MRDGMFFIAGGVTAQGLTVKHLMRESDGAHYGQQIGGAVRQQGKGGYCATVQANCAGGEKKLGTFATEAQGVQALWEARGKAVYA